MSYINKNARCLQLQQGTEKPNEEVSLVYESILLNNYLQYAFKE